MMNLISLLQHQTYQIKILSFHIWLFSLFRLKQVRINLNLKDPTHKDLSHVQI